MTNKKIIYKLSWTNAGAEYSRCFDTENERADFIPRIASRKPSGNWNYSTWENEIIIQEV